MALGRHVQGLNRFPCRETQFRPFSTSQYAVIALSMGYRKPGSGNLNATVKKIMKTQSNRRK